MYLLELIQLPRNVSNQELLFKVLPFSCSIDRWKEQLIDQQSYLIVRRENELKDDDYANQGGLWREAKTSKHLLPVHQDPKHEETDEHIGLKNNSVSLVHSKDKMCDKSWRRGISLLLLCDS